MNIAPIINRIDELYGQKKDLITIKNKLKCSISRMKKDIIKNEILQEIGIKSVCHNNEIESLIDISENQLKDIIGDIRKTQKAMSALCQLYISWSLVSFHDGYIEITFTDMQSKAIECSESKESFNYIKCNLLKKIRPFRIIWSRSNQEFILKDKITFKNAILYLSIKDELSRKSEAKLSKIVQLVSGIKNKKNFLSLFFDKSLYLEYLANKHSLDYLIIPAEEKMRIGSSNIIEDSFIFTINAAESIYIIWENINKERATFMFKTSKEEYNDDLQIIFDYIVGALSSKRKMLYARLSKDYILNSCIVIYHTDYRIWENKMETLLV